MLGTRLPSKSTLSVIFFLSGATGLVYEVIWVRLTGLVFGNTSHAISTVLGAFMAGLALGSWLLGRQADRAQNPLRLYGMLEVGIGLSAAVVPLVFRLLGSLYWATAPLAASIPGGGGLLRFGSSFVILLLPTFLMGGTLPVLTRFFTESVDDVEHSVGVLYGLNTFGAAVGTLLAALILIPGLGNIRTTLIVAAINVLIGSFAIWTSSRWQRVVVEPDLTIRIEEPRRSDAVTARLILLTLAISGFVSMNYEVAWTRALAAMIGSSTYAFSIMLVTFLIGIALGSSIAARWRPAANLRMLGFLQLGVAAGGVVFLIGYIFAPYVLIALMRGFSYSFPAILATQFMVCAGLMILATLCMGATLPIASQLSSSKFTLLGRNIGNIYSVNTLGAIAGSLIAGFLLMPSVGTERTIIAGLFLNSAMALLLLTQARPSPSGRGNSPEHHSPFGRGWREAPGEGLAYVTALVLLLVATISMRGGLFWSPDFLDRGILVYAQMFDTRPELTMDEHYQDTDVVYFKEGNNATISVRKGDDYLGLRTNGKVDASSKGDMMTQLAMGFLPGFYHPSPKSALVIGYGSGVTVGVAAAFKDIESIDCVDIEPAVVGAGSLFSAVNRNSYNNPKVTFTFDDARNFMNVTRKQYDLIISEPSNPWIAGVASLFTAEFYERASQVLKPDGVFAQWVQLYELDPEDLRMILKDFQFRFPEVSLWVTDSDLIIIGTRQPQRLDVQRISNLAHSDPSVMRDFRDFFHLNRPEGFLAYYVMSTDAVRNFAQTSRHNTDDHPLLEFHAPRQLFGETRDLNIDLLYEAKDSLFPPGAEIPDKEAVYAGMVEPFLAIKRSTLANQSMGFLAQTERKEEASLHLAMARLNLNSDDLQRAEVSLKQAEQLLNAESFLFGEEEELWGTLCESLGDSKAAMEHYERAANADPVRPVALRKMAEMKASQEAWTEAAVWMERYIATNPRSLAHYWAVLGDYRMAAGKKDEALQALQTALSVDPYVYWGHYRLARLFEQQKDTANAINQYEFLLKYAFDRDADIYVNLANLYRNSGRIGDARRVLKKGVRILPTNTNIYRLYREVLGVD